MIELKVGELNRADVGQMDGYVRLYDRLFAAPDDNPTIGLILCTERNETVARYSVLNDRKQIFASRYMLCLPTEEQLPLEIEKERRLLEAYSETDSRLAQSSANTTASSLRLRKPASSTEKQPRRKRQNVK